ncbi:MAG: tetratricopeptide repeat protein [Bacteroidales bacterium]|nr:tetratricopeptide repeat protein [Bacteroidales bacterium]
MKKILLICLMAFLCSIQLHAQIDSTNIKEVESYIQKAKGFYATAKVDSIFHYYNVAQTKAQAYGLATQSANVYREIAKLYLMMSSADSALVYFTKAADVARKGKSWKELNMALCQVANLTRMFGGKNQEALQFAKEAVEAGEKAKYVRGVAVANMQAGNAYNELARYEEALQCFQAAGRSFHEGGFEADVANAWQNMAAVYYQLEKFNESIEYHRKSMEVFHATGNLSQYAQELTNIGAIYSGHNRKGVKRAISNIDSMFYYFNEALKYSEELHDTANILKCRMNLGVGYYMIDDFDRSKKFFDSVYKIALAKNSIADIISIENGYALLYQKMGEFEKSREFFLKELPRIQAGEYKEKEFMWYLDYATTLDSLKEYEGALHSYRKYVELYDTLRNADAAKQMNLLSVRYGSELKDQEIAAAKERQELMSREQDALRKRFLIMIGASIIIAIFLIFVVYLFIRSRQLNKRIQAQNAELESKNEEIQKQNLEIERQKDEVTAQKEQIEIQQESIMDSIHYASRIQTAILPKPELVEELFSDHRFILFKPRDIVSGDYFWIGRKATWKIAIAADCTGHGVPGAFMSMLGTAGLNEIINDPTMPDIHAGEVLDKLRDHIIKSLKQTGAAGEQKDGMDLAMWMFNDETKQVRYAGANNPLIIVRKDFVEGEIAENDRIKIQEFVSETNNETYHIIQIAGNKQPIAIYPEMVPFEEVCLQLKTGDTLYTFSDGFQDQFGGPKGKKFMIKKLKQVFVNIYESPMHEQRELLDHELVDWIEKGNTEQIDDVLVIGYRV